MNDNDQTKLEHGDHFANWSSCAECGYPVGHDNAHPVRLCGRRVHGSCLVEHLKKCDACGKGKQESEAGNE